MFFCFSVVVSGSLIKEKREMGCQSTIFTQKPHGQATGLPFCLGNRNMEISLRVLEGHMAKHGQPNIPKLIAKSET